MGDEGNRIVPVGKYKGQPVEVLAADPAYREWIVAQPWFADRYRDVYNIVVNYGKEPDDTPDHNALQARFLDKEFCLTIVRTVNPSWLDEAVPEVFLDRWDLHCCVLKSSSPMVVEQVVFEIEGWDVRIRFAGGSVFKDRFGYDRQYQPWHGLPILVECKPTLSDDYPSVLRQIKGYRQVEGGHRILLVGTFSARGATLDQVRQIFASSGIRLVMLDEVLAATGR